MNPNWLMIFAGLAGVLLELFIGAGTGFDILLVGVALILGGAVGQLTGSWQAGVLFALVLTFAYVLFGRKLLKAKLKTVVHHTNIDALIGKKAEMTKSDQAKLDGETWRVNSDQLLNTGDKVKVISVEGVTLKVVKSD